MENKEPIKDKIYGMILEANGVMFLSVQMGASMEEAFTYAKLELIEVSTKPLTGGIKIGLFAVRTINELINDKETYQNRLILAQAKLKEGTKMPNGLTEAVTALSEVKKKEKEVKKNEIVTAPVSEEAQKKNRLIHKIIKTKDLELFKKSKEILTQNEIKYINGFLLDK